MQSINKNLSINEMLKINRAIYQVPDDRLYDLEDMFYYHQKWLLRYTDDKKNQKIKEATKNLMVALAWYLSIIDRFKINLQQVLAKRYAYKCPYCLEIPCSCIRGIKKVALKTGRPVSGTPQDVMGWQNMIKKIYPIDRAEFKNLEILRSQDFFHQSFRNFRRSSAKKNLHDTEIRSANYFVAILKTANNLSINLSEEYQRLFSKGCFICHQTPCECFYIE